MHHISLVKQCHDQFKSTLPSVALERRRTKFMRTFRRFVAITHRCNIDIDIVFCSLWFCLLFHCRYCSATLW